MFLLTALGLNQLTDLGLILGSGPAALVLAAEEFNFSSVLAQSHLPSTEADPVRVKTNCIASATLR